MNLYEDTVKYFSNQMLQFSKSTPKALAIAKYQLTDIKILLSSPISEKSADEKRMITDFCVSMVDLAQEILTEIEGCHEVSNSKHS